MYDSLPGLYDFSAIPGDEIPGRPRFVLDLGSQSLGVVPLTPQVLAGDSVVLCKIR